MRMTLVEPLRELFKTEVRAVGRSLAGRNIRRAAAVSRSGWRSDFGGHRSRLELLRRADAVWRRGETSGLVTRLWQSFAVLLPIQSVG